MLAEPPENQNAMKDALEKYNSQFEERIQHFNKTNIVSTWSYDAYTSINEILDNPEKYNFTDVTSYGNGPKFFWWDPIHPSCKIVPKFWELDG